MKRTISDATEELSAQASSHSVATNATNATNADDAIVLQFYSKSKNMDDLQLNIKDWRKRLSNFWPCVIEIDGRKYPSVEHAFQAAKARVSNKPEVANYFECGGTVEEDAAAAKRAGNKTGFSKFDATLDMAIWDTQRDGAMFTALKARMSVDAEFCAILKKTAELGAHLLHFERQGLRAYWGGTIDRASGNIVGLNRLGKMLMELRDNVGSYHNEKDNEKDEKDP